MRLHRRPATGYELTVLAAAPPLDAAMEIVLECWRDLEGERPLGFGCVGLVPFRAVLEWAEWHRVDRELTGMLITLIQRLDADRMEREASKRALAGSGGG